MMILPIERTINFLTPTICIICKAEGQSLCGGCFEANLPTPLSRCYMCNKLTSNFMACTTCTSRSRLRRVWWLGAHDGFLKTLIWRMKYQRTRSIGRLLAGYLASRLPYLPEDTIITPIPTASQRVRRRGYDQSVIMAKEFAQLRRLRYTPLLRRIGQIELIGKRRLERLKQMEKNLMLDKSLPPAASVLLIDDVLTTGATLEAAARLLREAGAKHVDATVITRRLLG